MRVTPGYVYWITGLSGSGKSTLGAELVTQLRSRNLNTLFLDGDQLRVALAALIDPDDAFSVECRKSLAHSYSQLAQLLATQGCHVVVATVSLFHEIHAWNRANIGNYLEIFLSASLTDLQDRDSRDIYSRRYSTSTPYVVGIDIPAELPTSPDFEFRNSPFINVQEAAAYILNSALAQQ